jgi:hypothetical protein
MLTGLSNGKWRSCAMLSNGASIAEDRAVGAAPAHYIATDGSINENSVPVRFVEPAE